MRKFQPVEIKEIGEETTSFRELDLPVLGVALP
jgi:hypothetical protein